MAKAWIVSGHTCHSRRKQRRGRSRGKPQEQPPRLFTSLLAHRNGPPRSFRVIASCNWELNRLLKESRLVFADQKLSDNTGNPYPFPRGANWRHSPRGKVFLAKLGATAPPGSSLNRCQIFVTPLVGVYMLWSSQQAVFLGWGSLYLTTEKVILRIWSVVRQDLVRGPEGFGSIDRALMVYCSSGSQGLSMSLRKTPDANSDVSSLDIFPGRRYVSTRSGAGKVLRIRMWMIMSYSKVRAEGTDPPQAASVGLHYTQAKKVGNNSRLDKPNLGREKHDDLLLGWTNSPHMEHY